MYVYISDRFYRKFNDDAWSIEVQGLPRRAERISTKMRKCHHFDKLKLRHWYVRLYKEGVL